MNSHYQDDKVTIHKIKCGPYDNNAYLIVCPQTNKSIMIDTPPDPQQLIEAALATDVQMLLITHNHFDHLEGFDQVVSAIQPRVGISSDDAHALPTEPDFLLADRDVLTAGSVTLQVLSTAGHTPGSVCFSMGKHLFSGDTLFPGGPGKTGSPENLQQIVNSIKEKLLVLDDDVAFYPGHGDDGTLKTAKEEYAIFASKEHPDDLSGDVLWLQG